MRKVTLDEILEELFDRGYQHGVSGGFSSDGESYAVTDAKERLKILEKMEKEKQ